MVGVFTTSRSGAVTRTAGAGALFTGTGWRTGLRPTGVAAGWWLTGAVSRTAGAAGVLRTGLAWRGLTDVATGGRLTGTAGVRTASGWRPGASQVARWLRRLPT